MNVLHVLPSMDPTTGGVSEVVRNCVPAMSSEQVGHEVLTFDAPEAAFLNQSEICIHALGPSTGPYGYCRRLAGWFAQNLQRFEVVIIHGLWQYHSYGTIKAINKFGKGAPRSPRLYVMPHGMLDPYFQRAKDRRLKAIRNYFFWKLIENRVIRKADALLFTCEKELMLAREPFSPYRPKLELNIGFGIAPPPVFQEQFLLEFYQRCPAVRGRPFYLFLSRIHPKKGVDLLVKAYLKLKSEVKDLPDLVIAGPGQETSYGRSVLVLADMSSIHFPGMLRDSSKWGAFYGTEAFILPSHQENFGIAVVEALACEKPVLISDQVNICREIEAAGAGIIAPDTEQGTYNSLKNYLWLKEEEKALMRSKAGALYHQKFSINAAAAGMAKAIYNGSSITN